LNRNFPPFLTPSIAQHFAG